MDDTNSMETLIGGREVAVVRRDGGREVVEVRQLGVEDYPAYFRAIGTSEIEQIAILCSQDSDWAKRLTVESQDAVVTAGREVNDRFFGRWLEREKERRALLTDPDQKAAFERAMDRAAVEVMREAAKSLLHDSVGMSPQPPVGPSPKSVA